MHAAENRPRRLFPRAPWPSVLRSSLTAHMALSAALASLLSSPGAIAAPTAQPQATTPQSAHTATMQNPAVLTQVQKDAAAATRTRLAALWSWRQPTPLVTGGAEPGPPLAYLTSPAWLKLVATNRDSAAKGLPTTAIPAGLLSTYGSLDPAAALSRESTTWTTDVLTKAFGLPRGLLGPAPANGTLLANATALFGQIAFYGSTARLSELREAAAYAAPALQRFNTAAALGRRLVEVVNLTTPSFRTIRLYTDVIPLPQPDGELTHLLVYSVDDTAFAGGQHLVTGFATTQHAVDNLFDPATLGPDRKITSRYQYAAEPEAGTSWRGTRAVVLPGKPNPAPVLISDSYWPPFFFAGRSGLPEGLGKQLLATCFPATGHTPSFQNYSLKRMQSLLETGGIDINIYSRAPGRDANLHYGQEPLFYSEYRLIARADATFKIHRPADLDGLRLGHLNGLTYTPEFKAYVDARARAGTLDTTDDDEANMRKLLAGRIDVYANAVPTSMWYAKSLGASSKVQALDYVIKGAEYYVTIGKASPRLSAQDSRALLRSLDGCLRVLKKQGRYQQFKEPYGAW